MGKVIAGIVIAILAASAISVGASMMLAAGPAGPEGPEGPQSETGPAGPQGIQGPEGPPGAWAVAQATDTVTTTSTSFVDMPDMSVSITLDAPSMLFITMSSQAWVDSGETMYWRAFVDGIQVYPVSY